MPNVSVSRISKEELVKKRLNKISTLSTPAPAMFAPLDRKSNPTMILLLDKVIVFPESFKMLGLIAVCLGTPQGPNAVSRIKEREEACSH